MLKRKKSVVVHISDVEHRHFKVGVTAADLKAIGIQPVSMEPFIMCDNNEEDPRIWS